MPYYWVLYLYKLMHSVEGQNEVYFVSVICGGNVAGERRMMQAGGPSRSVMMGQTQGISYLLLLHFCFTD